MCACVCFCSKIVSTIVSLFSSAYVMKWGERMRDEASGAAIPLSSIPHFDARVVCYPTLQNLKDYLSWRQADCVSSFCVCMCVCVYVCVHEREGERTCTHTHTEREAHHMCALANCGCCLFCTGHINNLYNTAFWQLVLKCGLTEQEAEARLRVGLRSVHVLPFTHTLSHSHSRTLTLTHSHSHTHILSLSLLSPTTNFLLWLFCFWDMAGNSVFPEE